MDTVGDASKNLNCKLGATNSSDLHLKRYQRQRGKLCQSIITALRAKDPIRLQSFVLRVPRLVERIQMRKYLILTFVSTSCKSGSRALIAAPKLPFRIFFVEVLASRPHLCPNAFRIAFISISLPRTA